jgi:hypothetical protein
VRELSIQVEPRREGSSMYHVPKMVLYTVKTSYLLLLARVTHGPARRWHS